MNPADSIPLRDIHLPDPVSWWPPAMGWWFLLLFSLLATWAIVALIRKLRKPVLKKSAKAELSVVLRAYKEHQNKHKLVQQLSVLLRRIGISYLPRTETAGITGHEWYQKINQLVDRNRLSEEIIELLSQGAYQKNPQLNDQQIQNLIMQTQQWVSALSKEVSRV